jgi:hypothetical protein
MKKKSLKFLHMVLILFLLWPAVSGFAQDSDFEDADFKEEGSKALPLGISFTGFMEVEQGMNITGKGPLHSDPDNGIDWVLANRRFRLQASRMTEKSGIYLKLDFVRDEVTGKTYLDVRELRLQYRLFSWMDLSVGRQVSTWGVGDMVFINDLFPKNWVANFSGRDMEAMKDSSTSLRATSYFGGFTLDMVYHPRFTADTIPSGCAFAVFDPNTGQLSGNPGNCTDDNNYVKPATRKNGEIAVALKKRFGGMELALYGYNGFYKNPKGVSLNPDTNLLLPYYPELSVIGASLEGQVGPGIFSAEVGYYDSREDRSGTNPLIENSMFKYLVGYRKDINAHLSAGIQWYREIMEDYDAYRASVGFNPYSKKKNQDTFTLRLTYKAQQDTLWISLFSYVRPQDKDSFTRLDISKRLDNHFSISGGVSLFTGTDFYEDREFGMQRYEDNVYLRLRYNF